MAPPSQGCHHQGHQSPLSITSGCRYFPPGDSWSLLLAGEFLGIVLCHRFHSPPTFRKELRRARLIMHGLPESPGDRSPAQPSRSHCSLASLPSPRAKHRLSQVHLLQRTLPETLTATLSEGTAVKPQCPQPVSLHPVGRPGPTSRRATSRMTQRSHRCPPKITTSHTLLHRDNQNTGMLLITERKGGPRTHHYCVRLKRSILK